MKKYLFITALIILSTLIACAQKNRTADNTGIENQTQGKNMKKVLIAYFSCTGNTRSLAEQITQATNAELYEIKPKIPYSSEDLNWRNNSSRSNVEKNDPSSRPAISDNVVNMEQYDIIFLGYPIWFGQAPNIIYTFLESYNFSGKTIVPFCTSGSSPIGSSASNLQKICSGNTTWLPGSRFALNASRSEIVTWINGLGLNITAE
jgi:flavodoxin